MTKEEVAINQLQDAKDGYKEFLTDEAIDIAIEAIEQTTWIPCSERSPQKSGHYWCTFGGSYLTGRDYYTSESDAKETFDNPEEYTGWQSQNVIAWMHLPKTYESQERDDKG